MGRRTKGREQGAEELARRRLGSEPPPLVAQLTGRVADRLPVGVRAAVLAPDRRGVAGLLLVLAVGVALAVAVVWFSRPRSVVLPQADTVGRPVESPSPAGSPRSPPPGSAGPVLVHVAGAVRRPGLVELVAGDRVADAIEQAGGLTRRADPTSVNLARPVVDGEQIVVLRRGASGPMGAAPGALPPGTGSPAGLPSAGLPPAGGTAPTAPVDLNTATLEQLDTLPGIGPVLAQRILDWRTTHGRFSTVEELGEVSGIGEATLADLRPLVTVGPT